MIGSSVLTDTRCDLQQALVDNGATGVTAQLVGLIAQTSAEAAASITPSPSPPPPVAISPPPPAAACRRRFGHWCIAGSRLDKADIAGIIVGGSLFVILSAAALAGAVFYLRSSRHGSVPASSPTLSDGAAPEAALGAEGEGEAASAQHGAAPDAYRADPESPSAGASESTTAAA